MERPQRIFACLNDFIQATQIIEVIIKYDSEPLMFKVNITGSFNNNIKLTMKNPTNIISDWGDGIVNNQLDHVYEKNGEYSVQIFGDADSLEFNELNSTILKHYLTQVISYGSFNFEYINFNNCNVLVKVPVELPISVIRTNYMFIDCKMFNQPLKWDTHNVLDMSGMFYGCANFNSEIQFSDTSNVKDMSFMFSECIKFNKPIQFNTKNVTDMTRMFYGCGKLNSDIVLINTTNVSNMEFMFSRCTELQQVQIYVPDFCKTQGMFLGSPRCRPINLRLLYL